MGQSSLTLSRATGQAIKYTTRYASNIGPTDAELDFVSYQEYEDPQDVPKARLSDEDKETCLVLNNPENYKVCEEDSDDLKQAAKKAFEDQMNIQRNGYLPLAGGSYNLPSTGSDYEMQGTAEEQAKINDLSSFVPGMVGRELLPVRNQGVCGSCYALGLSHSLSSAYNQANSNPLDFVEFSSQHIMNCMPLQPVFLNVSGALEANSEGVYRDGSTGCWGGDADKVIDFFVGAGLKGFPLFETEPYLGVSSHCNLEQATVPTGKFRAHLAR